MVNVATAFLFKNPELQDNHDSDEVVGPGSRGG
jgi:hypothetical protein